MKTETLPPANDALNRVRDLLHFVHEAARDFEAAMPPRRFEHAVLLTDCIHKMRQAIEGIAVKLDDVGAEPR